MFASIPGAVGNRQLTGFAPGRRFPARFLKLLANDLVAIQRIKHALLFRRGAKGGVILSVFVESIRRTGLLSTRGQRQRLHRSRGRSDLAEISSLHGMSPDQRYSRRMRQTWNAKRASGLTATVDSRFHSSSFDYIGRASRLSTIKQSMTVCARRGRRLIHTRG